jgi:energy-coupling factor transporter ATP-binding protein EcfA2
MKIIALEAENLKRIRAVEITPKGNLVEITGKNGQGKTSVLDAIWWALSGTKNIQAKPIRNGSEEACIRLDLGDIKITRTFRRKGDEQPSTLVVESAEGARFSSPQLMLDALVGSLSFDPLAFTRLDAKGKFEALRQFVPGVDFDQIAKEQKEDFTARTDFNRRAKEAKAAGEIIQIPHGTPEALIDETALVAELEGAGEQNATLEQRKARRENAVNKAAFERQNASTFRAEAAALRQEAEECAKAALASDEHAASIETKLAEAGELPPPVETSVIRAKIEEARKTNALVARRAERAGHLDRADKLSEESAMLTARMSAREKAKQDAIAAAKMPIPGLEFGDGEVLLNGVPFEQGSDAEQLRASIAIAMAANPKLRVIRVRDGSLLDEDSMAIVAEMAAVNDCQVWVETVGGTSATAIVIEDGMVRQAEILAAE